MLTSGHATPPWLGRVVVEASAGIAVFDGAGEVVYVNPSLAAVLGQDHPAPAGTNVVDLVHPDDLTRAGTTIARVADRSLLADLAADVVVAAADGALDGAKRARRGTWRCAPAGDLLAPGTPG